MTPQQTSKVPLRNTSAVPRTRKTSPPATKIVTTETSPTTNPAQKLQTPVKVSAKVALSTSRTNGSLRKALLVRSARKAWIDTRSPGVDGAIEAGEVEINRKSASPRSAEKRVTPMPTTQSDDEEDEEQGQSEEEDAEQQNTVKELQWVQEDGQEDVSLEESDSDRDSFDADMSLDIVS